MNDDPGDADRNIKAINDFFVSVHTEFHIKNKYPRMNLGHLVPFLSLNKRQGKQ